MDSSKSFSSKAVKPKKENGIAALAAAGLSGRYIASNVGSRFVVSSRNPDCETRPPQTDFALVWEALIRGRRLLTGRRHVATAGL